MISDKRVVQVLEVAWIPGLSMGFKFSEVAKRRQRACQIEFANTDLPYYITIQ